jgi:hypothetical protein
MIAVGCFVMLLPMAALIAWGELSRWLEELLRWPD